jgi:hypothetical protein
MEVMCKRIEMHAPFHNHHLTRSSLCFSAPAIINLKCNELYVYIRGAIWVTVYFRACQLCVMHEWKGVSEGQAEGKKGQAERGQQRSAEEERAGRERA